MKPEEMDDEELLTAIAGRFVRNEDISSHFSEALERMSKGDPPNVTAKDAGDEMSERIVITREVYNREVFCSEGTPSWYEISQHGTLLGDNVSLLEWMFAEDVPEPENELVAYFVWEPTDEHKPRTIESDCRQGIVAGEELDTIYARIPDRPVFDPPKRKGLEELLDNLSWAGYCHGNDKEDSSKKTEEHMKVIDALKAEILERFGGGDG